jgi:hypothetical protein
MLDQLLTDGIGAKSLALVERVLDGDVEVSSAQQRTALAVMSGEIKARGTRNRDVSNAITVIKMHPDKTIREAAADQLIRRLLPELPTSSLAAAPARISGA